MLIINKLLSTQKITSLQVTNEYDSLGLPQRNQVVGASTLSRATSMLFTHITRGADLEPCGWHEAKKRAAGDSASGT